MLFDIVIIFLFLGYCRFLMIKRFRVIASHVLFEYDIVCVVSQRNKMLFKNIEVKFVLLISMVKSVKYSPGYDGSGSSPSEGMSVYINDRSCQKYIFSSSVL